MKKTLFIAAMLLSVSNLFAQLVVNSDGRVGIGYNVNPTYTLTVDSHNEALDRRYMGYFNCIHSGLHIEARGEMYGSSDYHKGLDILSACPQAPYVYGIYSKATKSSYYPDQTSLACGVFGEVCDSSKVNHGVMGAIVGPSNTGAGIYGVAGSVFSLSDFPSIYAGFFRGDVRVTDHLYYNTLLTSAINSPSAVGSSSNESSTIRVITDENGEQVSEKLQQVELLQFVREDHDSEEEIRARCEAEGIKNDEEGERDYKITHNKISSLKYGLAADQLKEVYPELVYEDENGNVSINYVEMVPLLVQSINELTRKVNELEGKGTSTKKAKTKVETTSIEETSSEVDMVRMDQNKPNPFSESTVITLNIPKDTKSATIFIYDLSGKQVKSFSVSERGKTDITVYASDLTAGMYIYNLVVDGQVKVNRRMIVEK